MDGASGAVGGRGEGAGGCMDGEAGPPQAPPTLYTVLGDMCFAALGLGDALGLLANGFWLLPAPAAVGGVGCRRAGARPRGGRRLLRAAALGGGRAPKTQV
jgi:hypothetical protein